MSERPKVQKGHQFYKAFEGYPENYLHPFPKPQSSSAEPARAEPARIGPVKPEYMVTPAGVMILHPLVESVNSGRENPVRGRLPIAAAVLTVIVVTLLILQPEVRIVDPPVETSRQSRNIIKPESYSAHHDVNASRLPRP